MGLSPLQSRLAASLAASILVLAVYWLLNQPSFALATEIPERSGPEFDVYSDVDQLIVPDDPLQPAYEPEFALFDRSIIGRAATEARSLKKDAPQRLTMSPGDSACYMLSKEDIFGTDGSKRSLFSKEDVIDGESNTNMSGEEAIQRRADSKQLYVSASTCLQPYLTNSKAKTKTPPQLKIFASLSNKNGCIADSEDAGDANWTDFEEGLGELRMTVEDTALYVSIVAPKTSEDFDGDYDFDLVVSSNYSWFGWDSLSRVKNRLVWMDSDSSAALLLSQNITADSDDTDDIEVPYDLFVQNDKWPSMKGLMRSYCGMQGQSLITANMAGDGRSNGLVNTSITTRGTGSEPKQEFYFQGLNETSNYTAVLVQVRGFSNDTKNAKRQADSSDSRYIVSDPIQFRTLTGTTCKVITNLDFCTETQYAVPGNDKFKENSELAKVYDNYARDMYANFEKIMMQIPCETWETAQYSLVRTCDDCKEAYKRWLCTVAIPRCEDYFSANKWGIARNVGQPFPNGTFVEEEQRKKLENIKAHNHSRNAFIDEEIEPGPYKEILPCEEVCYEVVQSCPAAIGFTCPLPRMNAFEYSYGRRLTEWSDALSCNYPGVPRTPLSAAAWVMPSRLILGALLLGTMLVLI